MKLTPFNLTLIGAVLLQSTYLGVFAQSRDWKPGDPVNIGHVHKPYTGEDESDSLLYTTPVSHSNGAGAINSKSRTEKNRSKRSAQSAKTNFNASVTSINHRAEEPAPSMSNSSSYHQDSYKSPSNSTSSGFGSAAPTFATSGNSTSSATISGSSTPSATISGTTSGTKSGSSASSASSSSSSSSAHTSKKLGNALKGIGNVIGRAGKSWLENPSTGSLGASGAPNYGATSPLGASGAPNYGASGAYTGVSQPTGSEGLTGVSKFLAPPGGYSSTTSTGYSYVPSQATNPTPTTNSSRRNSASNPATNFFLRP